ncbi:hypothetical protein MGK_03869 [Candida albicans P57055]|nr:hypothetical protein MGK_03869 [Candida albicans P57055]
MSYNLANKIAIVTGGLTGIGLATTIKLLKQGSKVIVGDFLHEHEIDTVLNHIHKQVPENNRNIKFLRINIANYQDNVNLVDFALDEYSDLHYVVTNTAITTTTATASNKTETIDQFKDVIDTNLNGVFALNKLAINYWEEFHKPGSIVNVSNILGLTTTKGLTSYRVYQGGVQSLTQSLALAYANKDIRLNSVIPGYLKISPMLGQINQHIATTAIKQHPMARLGNPDEIANAIAFLLSDEASFVNGASLVVDGGYSAQMGD